MRKVSILCVLAALVAGGSAGGATLPRSGLYGVVRHGPITPVCRVDVPCDAPAPEVTLLFTRVDGAVARTHTDARGRYRIALRQGTYRVRTTERRVGRIPAPSRVRVRVDRFTQVDFFLDTGIR